jgi:cytochrome d ubiquinol oxidase subunit I
VLIGWPDEEAETNHFELAIPGFGSTVNNAGPDDVLPGLDQFAGAKIARRFGSRSGRSASWWAWAGDAVLGIWGAGAWALKRLDAATWYHRALVLAGPSGFIAVLTGWITAEVGRQPYVVYGVLRTADAVSPVPAGSVATSLLFFIVVYAIVFSAGALYILRLMAKGPDSEETPPHSNQPPGTPLGAAIEEAP